MSCDKPNGDCTNVSPCGSCGGSNCNGCGCGSSPSPVLPKCQDTALTPGTFTNATVVVSTEGCIVAVAKGAQPLYTPDECCGGSSEGGGSAPGVPGLKGDPGQAATIAVDPVIPTGSGTAWGVENIGSPTAAVFKFTAPASQTGSSSTSGATGAVAGLEVAAGLVKTLPVSLVQKVTPAKDGAQAALFQFTSGPTSPTKPDETTITLNLDAFYTSLRNYIDTANAAQDQTIADLTATVAALQSVTPSNHAPVNSGTPIIPSTTVSTASAGVNFAPFFSDSDGDALTFTASGLPNGLTINSAGLVTGTPTAAGSFSYSVTANDGRGGSTSLTGSWVVNATASGGGGGSVSNPVWVYSGGSCEATNTPAAGQTQYATVCACNTSNSVRSDIDQTISPSWYVYSTGDVSSVPHLSGETDAECLARVSAWHIDWLTTQKARRDLVCIAYTVTP